MHYTTLLDAIHSHCCKLVQEFQLGNIHADSYNTDFCKCWLTEYKIMCWLVKYELTYTLWAIKYIPNCWLTKHRDIPKIYTIPQIDCLHNPFQILVYMQAFDNVSTSAKNFIEGLLCVDTNKRLTARTAMSHPWIKSDLLYTHWLYLFIYLFVSYCHYLPIYLSIIYQSIFISI